MGDIVFNVAKGRGVEFCNRVDANDPANSALIVVLLASTGLVSDATMKDYATLAAVLAGASDEATNTGYARKTLTDSDITFPSPDNTNDRYDVDIPDQTWTGLANDGTGAIGALLVCYDDNTTSGSDTNIIPLVKLDFAVTPDGSDVVAVINSAGFLRAS